MTEDAPPAYHQVALLEAALAASRSATGSPSHQMATSGLTNHSSVESGSNLSPPPEFSAVVESQKIWEMKCFPWRPLRKESILKPEIQTFYQPTFGLPNRPGLDRAPSSDWTEIYTWKKPKSEMCTNEQMSRVYSLFWQIRFWPPSVVIFRADSGLEARKFLWNRLMGWLTSISVPQKPIPKLGSRNDIFAIKTIGTMGQFFTTFFQKESWNWPNIFVPDIVLGVWMGFVIRIFSRQSRRYFCDGLFDHAFYMLAKLNEFFVFFIIGTGAVQAHPRAPERAGRRFQPDRSQTSGFVSDRHLVLKFPLEFWFWPPASFVVTLTCGCRGRQLLVGCTKRTR